MDYKGQQLCEYIYSIITILFSVVSWFVGYFKGDFLYTFYGWAAGLAIALIVSDSSLCFRECVYLSCVAVYP